MVTTVMWYMFQDVPMVKAGNSSPTKIPGHAERQLSNSPLDAFLFDEVS